MYKEKVKVSKVERIVRRMKKGAYANQEELMYAMLDVLCANKEHIKTYSHNWSSDYNFSTHNFDDSTELKEFIDNSK